MSQRLTLPRTLDLGEAADRQALYDACGDLPDLRELAELYLDDYLRWFTAPEWRELHNAVGVVSPGSLGGTHRSSYSLQRLLEATRTLSALKSCDGFEHLIRGLQNPTQVGATLFEIAAAGWCATRAVHKGVVFSPDVVKANGVKHPDFLWQTELGDLYCECKEAQQRERDETKRLQRLGDVASDALEDVDVWPEDLRIDIMISGSLGRNPETRLQALVRTVAFDVARGRPPKGEIVDGAFAATVMARAEPRDLPRDCQLVGRIRVGTKPVRVDPENSPVTVARSLEGTRAKLVTDLVKAAKRQLPESGPAGVFVQMGGADQAAARLRETLAHPAHQGVVWACVFTDGVARHAVWQNDQCFDGRLLQ